MVTLNLHANDITVSYCKTCKKVVEDNHWGTDEALTSENWHGSDKHVINITLTEYLAGDFEE